MSEMDEKRQTGLARMREYVATLQPLMRLSHWEIIIHEDPPENDDASASMTPHDHDWRAWLRLSDHYLDQLASNYQRLHMVHELTHLYFRGLDVAHTTLANGFAFAVWHIIDDRYSHEMELAVDGLATIIAPHMPLPAPPPAQEA